MFAGCATYGPELETKGVRVAPVQSLEALWWLWLPHVRVAAQAFGGRGGGLRSCCSLRLRLLGAPGSHGCSSLLLHLQVAWTGGTSRWLVEDGIGGGGRTGIGGTERDLDLGCCLCGIEELVGRPRA